MTKWRNKHAQQHSLTGSPSPPCTRPPSITAADSAETETLRASNAVTGSLCCCVQFCRCKSAVCQVHSNNSRWNHVERTSASPAQWTLLNAWRTTQPVDVRASACVSDGSESVKEVQEVSGSPCQAASCSVSAPPQSGRTSVSHVRGQSRTERTMRLLTVTTLLLLFFSTGMEARLLFHTTSHRDPKRLLGWRLMPETSKHLLLILFLGDAQGLVTGRRLDFGKWWTGRQGAHRWPRWSIWLWFGFLITTSENCNLDVL